MGWRAINITEIAIDSYIAKRRTDTVPGTERPVAPATINRELAQLRRMLRLAYRRRKLAYVPTITMLPESQPRQGFVEEADFRGIVERLEPGAAVAGLDCLRDSLADQVRGAHPRVGARRSRRRMHPPRR